VKENLSKKNKKGGGRGRKKTGLFNRNTASIGLKGEKKGTGGTANVTALKTRKKGVS